MKPTTILVVRGLIVVRGFIPDWLQSSPISSTKLNQTHRILWVGAAAQPIGDKSPHHR